MIIIETSWRAGFLFVGVALTTLACEQEKTIEDSEAFGGARAVECKVNADCVGSDSAEIAANAKCPVAEFYCLSGKCEVSCAAKCDVDDGVTACEQGICLSDVPTGYCRMRATTCESVNDCPTEAPAGLEDQTGRWSCKASQCAYPGLDYPTK
jgi:hypothetical protein